MTPAGTRVVGLVRVSTAEQGDSGAGLAAQRAAIERECDHRGWELVAIEEDVASGSSTAKRPGLARALERVAAGEANGIVVAKLDRLSRSVRDFAALVEQARREGWAIIALDVGIDMTSPNGEMVAGVLAVLSQWERRIISARTREALAEKRAEGVKLGRRPQVDEGTRALIAEAIEGGMSYRAVARMLEEEQIPTASGSGTWTAAKVRGIAVGWRS